jgi:hypothetical protein
LKLLSSRGGKTRTGSHEHSGPVWQSEREVSLDGFRARSTRYLQSSRDRAFQAETTETNERPASRSPFEKSRSAVDARLHRVHPDNACWGRDSRLLVAELWRLGRSRRGQWALATGSGALVVALALLAARHFATTSWPLARGDPGLLVAAGLLLLLAQALKAYGWGRLFTPDRESRR